MNALWVRVVSLESLAPSQSFHLTRTNQQRGWLTVCQARRMHPAIRPFVHAGIWECTASVCQANSNICSTQLITGKHIWQTYGNYLFPTWIPCFQHWGWDWEWVRSPLEIFIPFPPNAYLILSWSPNLPLYTYVLLIQIIFFCSLLLEMHSFKFQFEFQFLSIRSSVIIIIIYFLSFNIWNRI